jgi:hypothetical protein
MAHIIPFEDRLRKQKEGALSKEKKQRTDSFRMVMQCTACPHKCAKCGSQLEAPHTQILPEGLPLKLCPGCWEEYRLFKELDSGRSAVEGREYYHNQNWQGIWKSWLEYQRNLQAYRNSEEFIRLVKELSQE